MICGRIGMVERLPAVVEVVQVSLFVVEVPLLLRMDPYIEWTRQW